MHAPLGNVRSGLEEVKASSYGEMDLDDGESNSDNENDDDFEADSEGEEAENSTPLLFSSFLPQAASYFLCICNVSDSGQVEIEATVKLAELIKDQVPSSVRMSESVYVVGGSCGLLLAVTAIGQSIQINTETNGAHSVSSGITAIEVSSSENVVVATGDQFGTLCRWNFLETENKWEFLSINLGSRIMSLNMSTTGESMCVGLWDRLLLVAVNDLLFSKNLFVRSVLDITKGQGLHTILKNPIHISNIFPF